MRRAALGAIALFAACQRHDAAPSAAVAESTSALTIASGKGIAPPPKDSGSCAAIAQARRDADAGAVPGEAGNCRLTKHGAWGMIPDEAGMRTNMPGYSMQLYLRVTHAAGEILVVAPRETWNDVQKMSAFDFDGDGEEELIIEGAGLACRHSSDGQCEDPLPVIEIFTFKNGAVSPYPQLAAVKPPPGFLQSEIFLTSPGKFERDDKNMGFEKIDDVDHDGRPDLVSPLFYKVNGTDGDVSSFLGDGPQFVAHSLPDGSFSLTDAVAMSSLQKACDALPSVESAGGRDIVASAVCARLRGQSVSQIKQKYNARCAAITHQNAKKQGDDVDWYAGSLCRKDTEGGWNSTVGIPASLVKMLEETSPLASKP